MSLIQKPYPDHQRVIADVVQRLTSSLEAGDAVTVERLARDSYYSRYYFIRLFRRYTRLSPKAFVAAARVRAAMHLIATTDWSMTDICLHVGYSSVGTFSRAFSRTVGMAPSALRQLVRSGKNPSGSRPPTQWEGPQTALQQHILAGRIVAVNGSYRTDAPVFVGAFSDALPSGIPLACTVAERGRFTLAIPEPGAAYIFALAFQDGATGGALDLDSCLDAAWRGSAAINNPATFDGDVTVILRPREDGDPPILFAGPYMQYLEARASEGGNDYGP